MSKIFNSACFLYPCWGLVFPLTIDCSYIYMCSVSSSKRTNVMFVEGMEGPESHK